MTHQINLYNPALRPRRELFSPGNVAVAFAISLCVVAAAGSVGTHRLATRKQEAKQAADQLKVVQDRVAALGLKVKNAKPDPLLQKELARFTEQADSRDAVLALMEAGASLPGQGYSEILAGLARRSLAGLWLTHIEVAGGSRALSLRGRATDRALVGDYLKTLNGEAVFAGRSFSGLRIELPAADTQANPGAGSAKENKAPERPPAYLEFALTSSAGEPEQKTKGVEPRAELPSTPISAPASVDREKKS